MSYDYSYKAFWVCEYLLKVRSQHTPDIDIIMMIVKN